MRRLAVLVLSAMVLVVACGGGAGPESLGVVDDRCKSLCASSETSCAMDVTTCEQECQVRVQDVAPSCATCLLENSNGGRCSQGAVCCPSPEFPSTVRDCGSACAGSVGVNPTPDHPICIAICANKDLACTADAQACLQQCDASVAGVTGLCALCLLEGANAGNCPSGQTCCPHAQFPTTVQACGTVCPPG